MAVTHANSVRQGVANYVVDLLDSGTGTKADLVILDGAVTSCTIDLGTTAFGAASSVGVATMSSLPLTGTATATVATADIFQLRDQSNTPLIYGSIGTSTGTADLALSSLAINSGDQVKITSFTYTAMP